MKNWKVPAALIVANLIYGANYSIAKEVMPQYIQPFGFIFARIFFGTILFWLFSLAIQNHEKVDRKDLPLLALCGLCGVAANQLLFFSGLNLTTPINASLIQTIVPVMVLVFAAVMIKERVSWKKTFGVTFGLVGAGLLVTNKGQLSLENAQLAGDLMIILNSSSYALFLVLTKPLMKKYQAQTVIKWVFFFGMLMTVPFTWDDFLAVDWQYLPLGAWLAIIYVVVFTTFLAYLLNTWALKHADPSIVGIYAYLQPLFATFIAISLGQDSLSWEKGLYSLLIFTGVYLVTRPGRKAVPQH